MAFVYTFLAIWAISVLFKKGLGYFCVWLVLALIFVLVQWLIGGLLGWIVGLGAWFVAYIGIIIIGEQIIRSAGYPDSSYYYEEQIKNKGKND